MSIAYRPHERICSDATQPTIPQQPRQRDRRPHPSDHTPARRAFCELIDAKAASNLLGVPYTWLLAQARNRKIPHHRLGHYVRFDPDELQAWLRETRIPAAGEHRDGG